MEPRHSPARVAEIQLRRFDRAAVLRPVAARGDAYTQCRGRLAGHPKFPAFYLDDLLRQLVERRGVKTDITRDITPIGQLRALAVYADSGTHSTLYLSDELVQASFRPDPAWAKIAVQFATGGETGGSDGESARAIDLVDQLYHESHRAWGSTIHLDSDDILTEQAASFAKLLFTGRPSLVMNLNDLARLYARNPLAVATLLRGDNPELRPVVRLALHDLVTTDSDDFALLGTIAQSRLPIPTHDLTPERLVAHGQLRPRDTLRRLVEYVDRSGVLRVFLDDLQATRPHAALLARVARAVALWDDAHTQLLTNVTARLQAAAEDIERVTKEPGDHG